MSATDLPAPLTPPTADLRQFAWMPLDLNRLFKSDTWLLSSGEELKCALKLWGEAWMQVPAGSLPNNERILAALAGAGRRWQRVRNLVMRGWVLCRDNRWYHPVVAEKVVHSLTLKAKSLARTARARARSPVAQPAGTRADASVLPMQDNLATSTVVQALPAVPLKTQETHATVIPCNRADLDLDLEKERKRETTSLPLIVPPPDPRSKPKPQQVLALAKPADPPEPPVHIPEWIPPDVWSDFTWNRTNIGKPLTSRAVRAIVRRLDEFRAMGCEVRDCLEQAIIGNHQNVYPVRPATAVAFAGRPMAPPRDRRSAGTRLMDELRARNPSFTGDLPP